MERQEFLAKLSIGLVAACAGCSLVSCSSKGSNPMPSPPPEGSGNLFAVDLSTQLANIGDSMVQQGVILVRIAAGNTADAFTAVQVACTHQGNSIGYNVPQGIFICPAHGSEFNKNGAVVQGPATLPLHKYMVIISGTMLTVSA